LLGVVELEVSIDGAQGILFSITGGTNLGMQEVAEAAKIITSSADDNVKVIFGAVIDETMGEDVRITVVATGFDERDKTKAIKADSHNPGMEVFTAKRPIFKQNIFGKKSDSRELSRPRDEEFLEEEPVSEIEEKPAVRVGGFSRRSVGSSLDLDIDMETPAPQSRPSSNIINQTSNKPKSPDEDLEIPAFIRKKMGM